MKEKEKIFFIYPPSYTINRFDSIQKPCDGTIFAQIPPVPVDMMSLATIAKRRGFDVKFKDYSLKRENVYDFLRDLRVFKPDFIVINVASTTLEKDLSILTQAQEFLENTVVIVKGAVFNFNSYSILQKYPEIDIALRGEIEQTFDEIIQYKNLKDIKGLTYQTNGKIFQTPDRELEKNLDHLPFLDRTIIDNNYYTCFYKKKPQSAIVVSKGCPNDCFFCLCTSLSGKNVRLRSPELIVEEIKECVFKYNIFDFIFISDFFNSDNEWIKSLCRLILKQDFKINFCVNMIPSNIDQETLKLMKKAGCEVIELEIESINQTILDKIGKNTTTEGIKSAVSIIKEAGIKIHAQYVVGLPWETKETINQTFKFACALNTWFASFNCAAALIGTEFNNYIKKNRLGEINFEKPYFIPSTRSYELSTDEIFEYVKKFNREYYLRAKHVLKTVAEVDSISEFKTYCNSFLRLIRGK